jgi:O-antigen/teichoic acid export membrane protein
MLKKIGKNSSYLAAAAIANKAIYFLFNIIIARFLGADIYGQFSYFLTFTIMFNSLPDIGIGLVLVRQLSRSDKLAKAQYRFYQKFNTTVALLTIFLIPFIFIVLNSQLENRQLIWAATILFILSSLRNPYVILLQAKEKMNLLAKFDLLNSAAPVFFASMLVMATPKLSSLLLGQIIGMSISLVAIWFFSKKLVSAPQKPLDSKQAKKLITTSLPLGVAAFFGMVAAKADGLVVGKILSTQDLGYFAAAFSMVTGSIGILSNPISIAALPALSKQSDKKNILKVVGLSAIAAAFFSTAIFFLSPHIIKLAFGSEFIPAIKLARILGFVIIFFLANRILEQVLLVKHQEKLYLFTNLCSAIFTVGLSFLFISKFHLIGAAWAKLISQFLSTVILIGTLFFINSRKNHEV